MAQIILIFNRPIASLYVGADNPSAKEILDIAEPLFALMLNTYIICGIMNVVEAMLRGIKYSILPTAVSIFTIIVFRIFWVYFIFPYEPFDTAVWLMASFPISWALATLAYIVITVFAWRKCKREFSADKYAELTV